MANIVFSLSRGRVSFAGSSFSISIGATSGAGDCLNSSSTDCLSTPWQGAIPLGSYTIFASEISDPGTLGTILRQRYGDWGDWRVPLHPNSGTNAFGRSGFFLHGGSLKGSAGCIDIGGGTFGSADTNTLKTIIEASRVITLTVVE